jgi:murein DD-endopeptidase MepM/ murein hydrolase activator NlpD
LLSASDVYQAGTVLASLTGNVTSGSITVLGRTYPLTKGARSMFAFVPIGIEDLPGDTPVKVDFTLGNGTKGTLMDSITILRTQWTVDSLTFTDSQTQTLLDPTAIELETKLLAQMYRTTTPLKLWDQSSWQVPTDGVLTARFGEQRSINGSAPSGHHGGTDLGSPEGTPVFATNTGRVIMVRQVQLRGNMVIIDHGGGVLSGYGHLADFAVVEGQQASAGDLIGHVGNTGLSTGAHLHWEMSIAGILVDALRFADGTNGF